MDKNAKEFSTVPNRLGPRVIFSSSYSSSTAMSSSKDQTLSKWVVPSKKKRIRGPASSSEVKITSPEAKKRERPSDDDKAIGNRSLSEVQHAPSLRKIPKLEEGIVKSESPNNHKIEDNSKIDGGEFSHRNGMPPSHFLTRQGQRRTRNPKYDKSVSQQTVPQAWGNYVINPLQNYNLVHPFFWKYLVDLHGLSSLKNAELFTLTYGSLISQLVKDTNSNADEINKQLERLGYNIGMRIIEDFLARSGFGRCHDLRDTADKIQTALKLYTPLNPSLTNITSEEFTLFFDGQHPFAEFAELPDNLQGLKYANLLPGIIRGACEMVQMEVVAWIEKDTLKGDDRTEVKVRFVRKLVDALPSGED